MILDPYANLRDALRLYDEWPSPEGRVSVTEAARLLVDVVERRVEQIEHIRRTVTPTQEAVAAVINWQARK